MNSQLRLTLPLLPDETARSYASRLAQRNNVPDLRSFCSDFGLPYQDLRLGKDGALLQLSRLSGAAFEALREQTIAYVGRTSYEFGNVTARRVFEKHCLFQFCPECLEEDKMARMGSHPTHATFGNWRFYVVAIGINVSWLN